MPRPGCGSCGGSPNRSRTAGASAKCLTCATRFYPLGTDEAALAEVMERAETHATTTGHTVVPITRNHSSRTAGIPPSPKADPFRVNRSSV